ncbi:MAG: hypothetical protein V7744_17650 [Pseudomonadales bacterium]
MAHDASTRPVLIGISVISQRLADPAVAKEAVALMVDAVAAAATDTGSSDLLSQVQRIYVPEGLWAYSDPARLIARQIGAPDATTVLAKIGVLQQSMMGDACQRIADGEIDLAVVAGGEAKYRHLLAHINGIEIHDTTQDDTPDVTLSPQQEITTAQEAAVGLAMPVGFYALFSNALAHEEGLSPDEHRDRVAAMYQRFSEISEGNPHAWKPGRVEADSIRNPSDKNPMLSFPYTKLHNTSWNVDQASALIFCSQAKAEQLGISRDKWVYPVSSTESNYMLPPAQRPELSRVPGARIAGRRALDHAGIAASDIDLLEMYSCFPVAVETYQREIGLPSDRDLTVTGGMPFAGGPLNNYVLQSTCRMIELLRQGKGRSGLVTSVSGMLTKQGFGVWSMEPAVNDFAYIDVTDEVAECTPAMELVDGYEGDVCLVAHTVMYHGGQPWRAVAIADTPEHKRVVIYSELADVMATFETRDCVGELATVSGITFHLA